MTVNDWGVIDTGFVRPTFTEALEVAQADLKKLYGQDIDLSNWSFFGQLAQMIARLYVLGYTEGEGIYDSRYVATAFGASLDNLAYAKQMTRNAATYATGYVTFFRSTAATQVYPIPAGTTVATADRSISFVTIEDSTIEIGDTTSQDVQIRAIAPGQEYNISASMISAISTPLLGIDAVTNAYAIAGGADQETDASFRARIRTYQAAARGTMSALESAILAIDGVTGLNLHEDTSNNTVSVYVTGGADEEISAAIATTRPAGILISWSRPSAVSVGITAVVTGSTVEITDAITTYLNNIEVGADVEYGAIIAVIMAAANGATISSLSMTTTTQTASALGSAITIADNEQATPGTITITTS